MQIDLGGRIAVVTGGSRGIGRAIAARFAGSGARVAICARRADEVERTVVALRRDLPPGAGVWGYTCDVARPEQIAAFHDRVVAEHGAVDILVNNAGTSARGAFESLSDAQWQEDIELKLMASVRLSRAVIPAMRARRWGRIVNILSVTGKAPDAQAAPTGVTRAAGLALTKILSRELAPDGILVNAICVGHILSDQWQRFHAEEAPTEPFEAFLRRRGAPIPLGRLGTAEEVANVACLLASDQGGYVTGTAINVDGGRSPVL